MGLINKLTDRIVRRLIEGFQTSLLIEEMKNTPIEFLDEDYYATYFDRQNDDRLGIKRIDSEFDKEDRRLYSET